MSRFQCFIFFYFYFFEKLNKNLKMVNANKIIEGSGTSFQSPALVQKHVRNIYHYSTLVFDQISF